MNIRVMYKDGKYDMIRAFRLDHFLGEDKIGKFFRNSEKRWVTIGTDPIRKNRREEGPHTGNERRTKDSI